MVARAAAEESKSPSELAALMEAIKENINVSYWLGWTWLACTAALMTYLIGITFTRYVRGIACLNNPHQRYFAEPNWWYARFKCYLFDSPLLRTRHHREYKLSSAIWNAKRNAWKRARERGKGVVISAAPVCRRRKIETR
ncbi:hypothetical protein BK809_0007079 [Diplodia seriata]|uniref:Uncharacterized protein n=1 Tax=Diplodia seriata TaxID=420778 RepID=A0A1S8BI70_9PEZI|nr:hypothetical protein BK809_0007079 [Diplodia seriata]